MPRCGSSTRTATSTPTASRATRTRSWAPPGWRASSGSSSRAGIVASSGRALDLVERFPWLDASVGVHPHDAAKVDDAGWARIVDWASDERVVAIGETGLDYDRVFSPIDDQLTNLRRNLALAAETGKPAILHCRSAAGQTRRPGRPARGAARRPASAAATGPRPSGIGPRWSIHSFSGPVDYARAMLDLGAAISFSGLVFRAGEEASAEVAAITPAERPPRRDRFAVPGPARRPTLRNEPEYVRITAAWVAERRGVARGRPRRRSLIEAYERTFPRPRTNELTGRLRVR